MAYRLGLDLGTNSIGWCVLDLDADGKPTGVRDCGVRIFTDGRDPQSGASLATDRRVARGARRNRGRYKLRRKDLMKALVHHGLMPNEKDARKALETLNPYELRARGLDKALAPHELGRALFHLAQRRGFRSNRISDAGNDDESGKVKSAGTRLASLMENENARTLGEFLHRRHRERAGVRARLKGTGAKAEYDVYPQRTMMEDEFDTLWAAQTVHNEALTDDARDEIRTIIFRQRPLRPQVPGKCALDPAADSRDKNGIRAPWALPLAQKFRILQELANTRIVAADQSERLLTLAERNKLLGQLLAKKKPTFKAMKTSINLGADERFNLEAPNRKDLKGDETAAVLDAKKVLDKGWRKLNFETQSAIVERLLADPDEAMLMKWLMTEHKFDKDEAARLARARLPQGHCHLGRRAISRIVPIMEDQGLDYAAAAAEAGYHHSDRRPGEILDKLSYYGEALASHVMGSGDPADEEEARHGRIANPTVHIGLNQTRRLVNKLIEVHGPPAEIVVELARELKLNKEQKDRVRKEQADNTEANEKRRKKIKEQGLADNGENRMRMRLWEELNPDGPLDRRCPYTGEVISIEKLFSSAVEIDHILPFSRTLDNSAANRTVAMRYANRAKGNKSPHEAFSGNPTIAGRIYDWDSIMGRAAAMPRNKCWRFGVDAMTRFENEERDFIDRQLIDTQYLARVAREYLCHVCNANKVWAAPGRLTANLRRWWGLNDILSTDANLKNRTDHRHHAVDAVVIAVTDRGLLNRISREAARGEEEDRDRLMADTPEPWESFRDDVRAAVNGIVVSHRPDHGRAGKLHEETAYGLVADPGAEDGYNLVYRKPLSSFNKNEIARIRDRNLRAAIRAHVEAAPDGTKLEDALRDFGEKHDIRRVRLLKKEQHTIKIADSTGKLYKALSPGDNHHVDILALPDGKWVGWGVTVFEANQHNGEAPPWKETYPAARRMARICRGDLLKLDSPKGDEIMRVVRLEPVAGRLRLAGHLESGNLEKRHADPEDPFRWTFASWSRLKEWRARKVHVDVLGRVRDPGFRE
ncbi:MAG: type II CRISPR RNA-guided endonuclease Cas9 [Rhodobacteraceae bacterium]|nr:type II CRISPR RNA-guided endonuclease Cas9 [Paracoccaceae bacterium]